MPWLLRTPDGEVPIEGTCVIGRSPECEVSIDDPNASRRHAALRVSGAGVVVEDLQSRNGTFVDGSLIGSPTLAGAGARIIVGHTLMTLVPASATGSRRSVPPPSPVVGVDAVHTHTAVPDRAMLARAVAALAGGRMDECGGAASIVMRRQANLGPKAEDEFVRGVSALLVTLAQRTGDTRWLEGVFQMNADCERVLAADVVAAMEALRPRGLRLLSHYVDKMSARAASLSSADRMILARVERLGG